MGILPMPTPPQGERAPRWLRGGAALILGAWFILAQCVPARAHAQEEVRSEYVRVTYYTLPGIMASGQRVHSGAAACSRWLPMGTQLVLPDGWIVTCLDRGHGDRYWAGWVDIWAPSHAWARANIVEAYGDYAWVTVHRWGWGE